MASQLSFYRNASACQINVSPGETEKSKEGKTFFAKDGAIFIAMTSGEKREYDWKKKIGFAISMSDLPAILAADRSISKNGWTKPKDVLFELIHDPQAGKDEKGKVIKSLQVVCATNQDSFFMVLNEKSNGENKRHFVSLSMGELSLFFEVVKSSIPYLLAWNQL